MSASKAWLAKRTQELEAEVAQAEWHIVFLLQRLADIAEEHYPEIEMNLAEHKFPEHIWRQVRV